MQPRYIYALFVCLGFLFPIFGWIVTGDLKGNLAFVVFEVCILSLLLIVWFRQEEKMGYPSGRLIKVGAIVFAFAFVPAHLLRTRGFKKGSVATLGFLGLLFLYLVVTVMGRYVVKILQP